jgi:hypothetical protein
MKSNLKVRGSMETVQALEIGIDTVYVRSNITKIEEEFFTGWEYDEIQYSKDEYLQLTSSRVETLEKDKTDLQVAMAELMETVATLQGATNA